MKAALISLGSKSSEMTLQTMKKYFDTADSLDIRKIEINLGDKNPVVLYEGTPIAQYDCIYAKGSFRYNPLLRSITAILGKHTYFPIRPSAFTIAHDKLLTQLKIERNDVPMPRTYLAATPESAKQILEKVNYPVIMKFPEGTQGKGVMYADSFASANSILDALTALRQPFIIQEYIETGGSDIRAFVVGDKVVAAMERQALEGEKRANIHTGGKGKSISLEEHTKKIAVKAAKAIGAEICAIDLLEGPKGPLVIEVNISPGLRGITEASTVDVADKIAKFLFEKSRKFKDENNVNGTKKILDDVGITEANGSQEIITNIDFRSNRILLPAVITNMSELEENDEVIMKIEKGKIKISKTS